MSIEEIRTNNTGGAAVVYVSKGGNWNNTFRDDCILWQAAPGALTMAENSQLQINGRTVTIVDRDGECPGFYYIGEIENERRKLELYFKPHSKNRLFPAPRRPPGPVYGHYLDKETLNKYLVNLTQLMG